MDTQTCASLVASGNTYNPSLILLRERGYDLWLESGDEGSLWFAKRGGHQFLAYSATELLGLVALWERFGDRWNQQEPDILGELFDRTGAPPDAESVDPD